MNKEYREDVFSVKIQENVFTVQGAMENFNYETMASFLKAATSEISDDTIIIDFTSARYINSIGIRIFAIFIFDTDKNIIIRIDHSLDWQNGSLGMLSRLKPQKVTIV